MNAVGDGNSLQGFRQLIAAIPGNPAQALELLKAAPLQYRTNQAFIIDYRVRPKEVVAAAPSRLFVDICLFCFSSALGVQHRCDLGGCLFSVSPAESYSCSPGAPRPFSIRRSRTGFGHRLLLRGGRR